MKRNYALGLAFILIVVFAVAIYFNRAGKKTLSYIKAIDKVYNSKMSGMALIGLRTSNLYGTDAEIIFSETGTMDNNFSANSEVGVKLWEAKQLSLNIKNLKVLNEALPEFFEKLGNEYYIIQTNHAYYGKDAANGLYYLTLFVNSKDYHIYVPKDYYEPNKLLNSSTVYIEYEPNEIVKKLVNDIIKQ